MRRLRYWLICKLARRGEVFDFRDPAASITNCTFTTNTTTTAVHIGKDMGLWHFTDRGGLQRCDCS